MIAGSLPCALILSHDIGEMMLGSLCESFVHDCLTDNPPVEKLTLTFRKPAACRAWPS